MLSPVNFHPLAAAAIYGATVMAAFGQMSPADFIILAVALSAAFASYRGRAGETLRRQNADLEERNRYLEAEQIKQEAKVTLLEGRPTVDSLERSIERLSARIEQHDKTLNEMLTQHLAALTALTERIIPPV